jgi:hypothetical protein
LLQFHKNDFKFLTWLSFGFRAIFILSIPNLSQDFYRFIWDGRIFLEGLNPYLYKVESFASNGNFPIYQGQDLYEGMGNLNASHFSNYPPVNQLCFLIAGLFAGKSILGSVVVLRLLIISADLGTIVFGRKLLKKMSIPEHYIFWYILNPFIIIELTGNLHFEGVMLFFLVWSLYLLHKGKWQWAAALFAISVSVKLIPLIFLPLFYQRFTKMNVISNEQSEDKPKDRKNPVATFTEMNRLLRFYGIVGVTTVLLFLPFYSPQLISNYSETVGLWFKNFEFNASLYYIAREIGYLFRGFNEIAIIGKYSAILVFLFVLALSFIRRNKTMKELITAMLIALSFYYFTATTVHPWYVATLLLLSVFTRYRFPLVWSFVIILSYLSYLNINSSDKAENLWIITLEYLIVYGVFIYEVFIKNPHTLTQNNS